MYLSDQLRRKLTCERITDHFLIRYQLRNPRHGRSPGRDGVPSPEIVESYAQGLEEAYELLTSAAWRRNCQEPLTEVLICDVSQVHPTASGLTMLRSLREGRLELALTSHPLGASADEDRRVARGAAIHECVHLFNLHERPLTDALTERWIWLDEATAVYYEALLCSPDLSWVRYGVPWLLHPERSLVAEGSEYGATLLVDALVRTYGKDLLRRIWMEARREQSALEALDEALAEQGSVFSDGQQSDFFGSVYCAGSWFGRSSEEGSILWAVTNRYGERALRESWDLAEVPAAHADDTLDCLACHHYRAYLPAEPGSIPVVLAVEDESRAHDLKVVVSVADADGRELAPRVELGAGRGEPTMIEVGAYPAADQLILTVIHCGWRDRPAQRRLGYTLYLGS